jgi:BASS family bile acid:Na+ symporter
MDNVFITQVVLPAALFTIMLGVGLSLSVRDFSAVLGRPVASGLGIGMQLLLLPVLGFVVATVMELPPVLAVGLMILTFAPGGATSNLITFLARGDTALSVSMTAVVSVIAPFTLPLLTVLCIEHWLGQTADMAFPVLPTIMKLVTMTIVPIAIGVAFHEKFPAQAAKLQRPVKVLSVLFLLLVVIGITRANWARLPELLASVGPALILLITLAFLAAFIIAHFARLDERQAMTLGIEVGIQNAGIALLVAGTILQNAEMAAVALAYGILMNVPAALLIVYRNLNPRVAAAT